jgi:hypothetical protein
MSTLYVGMYRKKCTQGEQNNLLTKKMDPLRCSFLNLSLASTKNSVRDKSFVTPDMHIRTWGATGLLTL